MVSGWQQGEPERCRLLLASANLNPYPSLALAQLRAIETGAGW